MADDAQSKPMNSGESGPGRASPTDLLAVAAWFGLVTGLLEGISRTVLQSLGGVSWEMLMSAASVKIVWVAPFFYIFLFSLGGAVLALLSWVVPRLPTARAAVFLFGLAGFADVLSSSGRVSQWGVGMLALGLAVVLTRWFNAHEKPALRFWRRSVGWVAALALLAFAGIETGLWMQERNAIGALPPAAPGAPNVLVILVDTLRADHLSLYGYERKTSPTLERMAEESVVFENAFATSSWTVPSHASMLTGLYPSGHGAQVFPLGNRPTVLPEVLRARGYRTAAFSANTLLFTQAQGFGRGFIRFEDYFRTWYDMATRTLIGRQAQKQLYVRCGYEYLPRRRRAATVNAEALRWLEKNPALPFFAFLNYMDVHPPLAPPDPYRYAFTDNKNAGALFNKQYESLLENEPSPKVVADGIDAYDGATLYVDEQISSLLAELGKRGLSQNTIVIIASDHGESFGEHGLYGHQTSLYWEQIRVPLIIRWLGKIPGGKRIGTPVSLASLPATAMSLISEQELSTFPGPSLARAWKEPESRFNWPYPVAELAATPEINNPKVPPYFGALKAMVSPQWYYIIHEKLGPELYDMRTDPRQLKNLAKTPEAQAVVKELDMRLRETLARTVQKRSQQVSDGQQ